MCTLCFISLCYFVSCISTGFSNDDKNTLRYPIILHPQRHGNWETVSAQILWLIQNEANKVFDILIMLITVK
jgi:hypothetical protein